MPAGGICLAAARVMRSIAFARVLTALCSNSIAIDLDVKLQTGSGAYRVGTAGGIGGGRVGVPFPSSMSIQFPQIQLQFHSCNWDPIPQFQLRIGTHTAISIPIGAPISMTGPCNRKCPIYWAFQLHWAQLAVAIQFNRYFLSRVHVEPALRIGTGIL